MVVNTITGTFIQNLKQGYVTVMEYSANITNIIHIMQTNLNTMIFIMLMNTF